MKQERRIWRAHVQPVVRHSEVGQKTGLWVITPSLHRAESTPAGITDAYWYDGGLRSAGIISELVAREVSNRNLLNPLLSHLFAGARSFEDLVLIEPHITIRLRCIANPLRRAR
jgi:hypothetical protein